MSARGFCVKVDLDLHAVTCPGVWLCPNGKVALRIDSMGSYLESCRVDPVFPLLFHNKFVFKKMFTGINTLVELQHCMEVEPFYAELLQWSSRQGDVVCLATFRTNLAEILYPAPCFKGLFSGIDVDLLMDTEKAFPGIIAPKIEISTKTVVEEMIGCCKNKNIDPRTINPKIITSKNYLSYPCCRKNKPPKTNNRQKKVCHSQGPSAPLCHKEMIYRPSDYTSAPFPKNQQKCYHSAGAKSKFSTSQKSTCQGLPLRPDCSKECSVCSKYRHYFLDQVLDGSSHCSRSLSKSKRNLKLKDPDSSSDDSVVVLHMEECNYPRRHSSDLYVVIDICIDFDDEDDNEVVH